MLALADVAIDEPSNFKVQTESAKLTRNTSLISPGTSSKMDELSSLGNWANRSAMAWLLIAVGVSTIISYCDNYRSHCASLSC